MKTILKTVLFTTFCLQNVIAAPPRPIKGEVLSGSENLDSTCFIAVKKPGGKAAYCTATLINSQFVLTAAHCVQDLQTPDSENYIACGYTGAVQGTGADAGKTIPSFKYISKNVRVFMGDKTGISLPAGPQKAFYDVGIVKLNEPTTLKPMKTMPVNANPADNYYGTIEKFFSIQKNIPKLKPGVECRIAGFGPSDQFEKGGFLFTADLAKVFQQNHATFGFLANEKGEPEELNGAINISPKDIWMMDRIIPGGTDLSDEGLKRIRAAKMPSITTHGDSGGPLYCRTGTEDWTLLGVIQGAATIKVGGTETKTMNFHFVGSGQAWGLINTAHAFVEQEEAANKAKQAGNLVKPSKGSGVQAPAENSRPAGTTR